MENENSKKSIYGYNEIIKYKDSRDDNDSLNKAKIKILFTNNQNIKQKVIKMIFTDDNQFILTSNGEVYSRGIGDVTGRIKTEKQISLNNNFLWKVFKKIEFPGNEQNKNIIYDISAGNNHVLALDDDENIFGWGKNDFLQINPKEKNISFYQIPILIPLDNEMYSIQKIFALKNSSYAICKNNKLISWGEINEKFNNDENKEDFKLYSDISDILYNISFNDENNFTDFFLDSEQIINPNNFLSEETNDETQLNKLNIKLIELRKELDLKKTKESLLLSNNMKMMEKNDKKISSILSIIKEINENLNKKLIEKDKIHKQLIKINEVINQEKANLQKSIELLNNINQEGELITNEISELKNSCSNNINHQIKILKKEKKSLNKKIFADSLKQNLIIISNSIDNKQKEKELLENSLKMLDQKEKELLNERYILNDTAHFLCSDILKYGNDNNKLNNEKNNNEILQLITNQNEKLSKISFFNLNIEKPYMNINELLLESNNEIMKLKEEFDIYKNNKPDPIFYFYFDLYENKINLLIQQNNIIEIIYAILKNLKESDVVTFLYNKNNTSIISEREGKINNLSENNKINPSNDINIIYKQIILNLLNGTENKFYPNEEKDKENEIKKNDEKKKINLENYIINKNKGKKKLILKEPTINSENSLFNIYQGCSCYNYKNERKIIENNRGSNYNWGFDDLFIKK